MNQIDRGTINYRDELIRKMIHLCSLGIPIVYYFIPRNDAIIILSAMALFAITLDLGRYFSPGIGRIFYRFFGFMLRDHELDQKKKNLNGATYVLLSALLCVILFPKVIFLTAFSILIISDTMAALIGRKYGKHKFLAKSLEGTVTFFITGIIVILFTPKLVHVPAEYYLAIFACAVGAIVENVSWGIADDNLSIPISIGLILWGGYMLYFPGTELILSSVPN
ncbi:MAG: dolichol kinase [Ignavibacteriaceae bacterium]|nr:dolichol kinase [Ignavibacteriaceae bacterium]